MDAKHFSHNHGLVLHHQPPHQGLETRCSGCKTPLSGETYVCWQCNYFLHVQCFRATRSLKHPSHPLHPLTLLPFPTYPSASFICNLCNLTGDGFSYTCSACQFDIHVHCAHLNNNNNNNNNPLVPSTPIAANPNYNNNNPIYPPPAQTSPYPTYPPSNNQHSYPPQPQITAYPPNPNSPYPSYPTPPPPNDTQHYNAFHQTPGVHQNPAFPQPHSIPPPQHYIPPANNPLPNTTVPTYTTVMNTATDNPPQPKPPANIIKHFSHAHALKFMEIEGKSSKICSACEFRLSGSAYCCTEGHCPFSLHKSCYDAPREFQHKSHLQHPLTLIPSPPYSDGFTCNACLKDGKAFAYTCATCSYDLHIDCVQWPEKVTRLDHGHALTLYYSSPAAETSQDVTFVCDACQNPVHEMAWVYYCRECDFGTHLECVTSGVKQDNGGGGGGGGEKSEEELIREAELKYAVLQLLMGAQGRMAALQLI